EIHAARDVVKTSTYRVQTFRSLDFGALGHVDGDGVHFYRSPSRKHMPDTPFAALDLGALPRVDIVYSYAGADGALVDAAVVAGARGIVSAGFAPCGISGRKTTSSGSCHFATLASRNPITASGASSQPGFATMTSKGRSSHFGCGRPITAASATSGWPIAAFSSSIELIHSPPDL